MTANMAAGSCPAFTATPSSSKNAVANLEGAILISGDLFPYFLLVALEAGGPLRALLLLLVAPVVRLLELAGCEGAALRVMIFVATAGVRAGEVKAVAKATLPRFFLEDMRDGAAYRAFAGCGGRRFTVTACPRVMAELFLREYLDVDCVLSTELRTFRGFFLGLPAPGGLMNAARALEAVAAATAELDVVHVGVGRKDRDEAFMSLCAQQYRIQPAEAAAQPVPRCDYPKPLIFHDGRLVSRPTPLAFLTVVLWLPLGVLLAAFRIIVGVFPDKLRPMSAAASGLCVRFRAGEAEPGRHAPGAGGGGGDCHVLYVCNHRTLLDPVILATVFRRRKVTAVTYSLSKLSEIISPIPTVRLSRDRFKDGELMRSLLESGDVVVCPEGTTCREPYLLRFSPLFAELTEYVCPVAVTNEGSMFYGTTVRGNKCWDSFFFLMNPRPFYSLQLLEKVTCGAGRSKYDVANDVQRAIAMTTGFKCTNLTRKDKYRMIIGHDG